MERLNFKLEFADNGVIVTDDSSGFVNVYEEKETAIITNIRRELSAKL